MRGVAHPGKCGGIFRKEEAMQDHKNSVEELAVNAGAGAYVGIIRLQMVRERECLYGGQKLSDPADAVGFVRPIFTLADREMIVVVSVSGGMEPLAVEVVAVGGVDSCYVDMKNLFKHVILNNAGNIICFHNHPGGTPLPSSEDKKITEKIRKAGRLLDIRLLDHIILCDNCYYSFSREGAFDYD